MLGLFEKKTDDEVSALNRTIKSLEGDKKKLKEEVSDLTYKKKMETEDIKHMVKISAEKKDLEIEKEKMKLEGEKASEIATVKDTYRDKMETQLTEEKDTIKEMYSQILERLPNYNVNHAISEGKK